MAATSLPPHEPALPSDVHILAWMLEDPHQQLPEHSEPRARLAQEEALQRTLARLSEPELLSLLHDHRSSVRRHAARALGRRGGARAGGAEAGARLQALLRADPCHQVCQEAAAALGSMALAAGVEVSAIATLMKVRHEDHVEATRTACDEALVRLFTEMPLPQHLHFAKEGDAAERTYAVQTLATKFAADPGRWRWQVLPPLTEALRKDAAWPVKESAAQALRAVGVLDPAGAGAVVVSTLERFLIEDQVSLMVQILSQDPQTADRARRVQDTCKEALLMCLTSLAFFGWKLACGGGQGRALPGIQWTIRTS